MAMVILTKTTVLSTCNSRANTLYYFSLIKFFSPQIPPPISLPQTKMSSSTPAGSGHPATADASKRYFCHQCDRTVTISPSPSGDLLCPLCNGGFIEEFDLPPPNPNPNPNPFFPFDSPSDSFFPPFLSNSFEVRTPTDLAALFGSIGGGGGGSRSSGGSQPFNPFQFVQNYIQAMVGDGSNIQLVFEGGGGHAGNLGDYFIGPGLEQLIQQLAENDPNRYGTPPAAKSALDSLPDVNISQAMIDMDDGAQCAVCKDEFEIGAEAKQMPCKHLYHKDCIIPWLELHNSCPVCRFELPTDDQDYENRRQGLEEGQGPPPVERGLGLAVAAAGEGANAGGPRALERMVRIQLPSPYRAAGSQAEASNAGRGGNESGGAGSGPGSETRQEDLD